MAKINTSQPASGQRGLLSKLFWGTASAGILAIAATVADQALTNGKGTNLISAGMKKARLQGLEDYPYASGFFDTVKSFTQKISNTLRDTLPEKYAGLSDYIVGGSAALLGGLALKGGLSYVWPKSAFNSPEDIADKVIKRIRGNTRTIPYIGKSTASKELYFSEIKSELSSLKRKANQILTGATVSRFPDHFDPAGKSEKDLKANERIEYTTEQETLAGYRDEFQKLGIDPATFAKLKDTDIAIIAQNKAEDAMTMGTGSQLIMLGLGAVAADYAITGGAGLSFLISTAKSTGNNLIHGDGLSSVWKAVSSPYDSLVGLVDNVMPHDYAKLVVGMAMGLGAVGGGLYATNRFGGIAGIGTMLAIGAAAFAFASNSSTDVNFEKNGLVGPYAKLLNTYAPDFTGRLG